MRDFCQYFGRGFERDVARRVAAMWGVDPAIAATLWWEDFVLIELSSAFARSSVRVALAHGKLLDDPSCELGLFQLACRFSLGHELASHQLRAALRYRGDPLWPALARHIARISTASDRALLEDLAARPEQRDGPLSWALRYYVRGDIMLSDGTAITLDELCDELGAPRFALLEDMPPEIELDFGKSG